MPIKKLKPMTIEEYDIWDTIPAKDSVKFSFDQLNDQDTLSISAFIADCGEFGGHKEFLKCYNTGDSYCIQHYSEPACDNTLFNYPPEDKGRFSKVGEATISKPIELNEQSKGLVINYLRDFSNLPRKTPMYTNAPTRYWVTFKEKKYYRYFGAGTWTEFIKLRDKLYK